MIIYYRESLLPVAMLRIKIAIRWMIRNTFRETISNKLDVQPRQSSQYVIIRFMVHIFTLLFHSLLGSLKRTSSSLFHLKDGAGNKNHLTSSSINTCYYFPHNCIPYSNFGWFHTLCEICSVFNSNVHFHVKSSLGGCQLSIFHETTKQLHREKN